MSDPNKAARMRGTVVTELRPYGLAACLVVLATLVSRAGGWAFGISTPVLLLRHRGRRQRLLRRAARRPVRHRRQ